MLTIVRYKNGSLYCKDIKQWLTLQDVFEMAPFTFEVIEAKSKEDITAEVTFLARVDKVRREGAWNRATVVFSAFNKGATNE